MSHFDKKLFPRSAVSICEVRTKGAIVADEERTESLQFMLPAEELAAIDEFRFQTRMPSRSAAVRELLRRGLAAAEKETRRYN